LNAYAALNQAILVNPIQTSSVASVHFGGHPDVESPQTKESIMKNALLALFVVPLLTMPAFAGSSNVGDKPMVVAEGADVRVGVGVGIGDRHRHRDHARLYMSNRGHHHHDRDRR
jgi:hypothetical protein